MSETNLFNRMLFGSNIGKRTAITPNPQSSTTPIPATRNRRWQSDTESTNQDSDFDSRSVDGGIIFLF